jgi:DNA polymerase-3 subunit epsilon
VDPDRDPGPTHVHGISAEMVTGAPPFSAVHPYLAGLLSGRVVVGHNVDRFDLAFLRAECRRLGGAGLVPGPLASIDTLEVAQRFLPLPGKARLVDCCDHFGLQWDDHHSALGDAQVTADLFAAMRQEVGEGRLEVDQRLRLARVSRWPGGSDLRPATYGRAAAPTG